MPNTIPKKPQGMARKERAGKRDTHDEGDQCPDVLIVDELPQACQVANKQACENGNKRAGQNRDHSGLLVPLFLKPGPH